jgi:dinuclear metal center YbgI/SA1388 family protein
MPTVNDLLDALEAIAPKRFAFPWDKIGLQVGDATAEVRRAAVSLDRSLGAFQFAKENDCQVLLSHHPLIFEPIAQVTPETLEGKTVIELLSAGISFIAAHTNWDAAPGGINDVLAAKLDLSHVNSFGSSSFAPAYKLVAYCPESDVDSIVDACSRAGAGQIGNYERCAFCSDGVGTFGAGLTAQPAVGNAGERSIVDEIRVEMFCFGHLRQGVEAALRQAHPYEEPAFDFIPLDESATQKMGRIGDLPKQMALDRFEVFVERSLDTKCWTWGAADALISRVAVVGGAADSEWRAAQEAGADVLVTGEVKQHIALEASAAGFAIIAAGHYATEHPGAVELANRMRVGLPGVEWLVFEPSPGTNGRPY